MDALIKTFFDKKVGDFLKVDQGNLRIDPSSGQFQLKKASIDGSAFDGLHLPVALRGGFIDELSVNLHLDVFNPGGSVSLQILIRNVFFVFGPHTTDWSWAHVKQCKSKLVDLVMKIAELKPSKKAKKSGEDSATGWLSDIQTRIKQDLMKKVAEMIEVNIANFHIRFEDSVTQPVPYACGFKLGYAAVFANEDNSSQRTTGVWRHTVDVLADPLFCQTIVARRMSVYWDLGKGHQHFAAKPVAGQEVFKCFRRLNLRETFSACVVEKLLELFPASHQRRRYMDGPTFRERLDFHQYIVFPAGLSAHVTANKTNQATKIQKAPLRDADVRVYTLDVAVDSEQLRSVNALVSHVKNFMLKDTIMLSRPSQSIGECRDKARRPALVRAWWQHALRALQLVCKIPKRELCAEDLQKRKALREKYISAVIEAQGALAQLKTGSVDAAGRALMDSLEDFQMKLKLKDILEWRLLARDRIAVAENSAAEAPVTPQVAAVEVDEATSKSSKGVKEPRPLPNTLQVKVTFQAFQVYFLVAQGGFWYTKCKPGTLVDEERPEEANEEILRVVAPRVRQPVLCAAIKNAILEVINKGHSAFRIARWIEVSIGQVSVVNLNAGKNQPSRHIVSIKTLQKNSGNPMCIFLGVTTFELFDKTVSPGDTPISSVLEPWEGLLGHLKDTTAPTTPAMLQHLGFLKDQVDDLGKLMTFAYLRIGEVKAMDWAPFRRRLQFFLKRGRNGLDVVDLERRPSEEALLKELLVKLQQKVELAVGKSNMLGMFEVEFDGISGRTVDHYNRGMVLCKQAQLNPLLLRVRRSGQPQALQVQVHNLNPMEAFTSPSLSMLSGNGGVNLLPWKSSILLLPQVDFYCTAGNDRKSTAKDKKKGRGKNAATPAAAQAGKRPRRGGSPPGSKTTAGPAVGPVSSEEFLRLEGSVQTGDMLPLPLDGAYFYKWCRSGRAKYRYVSWDEASKSIVWKDKEKSSSSAGVLPVWKIQDICVGKRTPVALQAEKPNRAMCSCLRPGRGSPKLTPELLFSVVAEDRTLDLQAENPQLHKRWVEGLRLRFQSFVRNQGFSDQAFQSQHKAKYRVYPQKFRSDLCELRLSCEKLQAMTSFTNTIEAVPELADPLKEAQV